MNYTNKTGLPAYIADILRAAHQNDGYDGPAVNKPNTISVSRLIAPAQKVALERDHADELTVDVSDLYPALLGQAIHLLLERAGDAVPKLVSERRLTLAWNGWTISGKQDLYETEDGTILDYKNSSVWAYVFGKLEWEQQDNVYAFLSRMNGHPVTGLKNILFCTDWRRGEAKRDPKYPARIVEMPIPLWDQDKQRSYVNARLEAHKAAADGNPASCTEEERWARPTTYAVVKAGQKRAVRVFDNAREATEAARPGTSVVERPAESVRCASWCLAAPFCPQWAKDPTNPVNTTENGE